MKIALIMPPMDSQEKQSNNFFKFMHDFSKGKPYWNSYIKKKFGRSKEIDYEAYPNGLVQLATILKKEHDVKIFNFLLDDTLKKIISFDPGCVGITCSTGSQLIWIDKISRILKNRLDCKIILGGPHATMDPKQTLATTIADYVLMGETEFVFLDLVNYLDGKGKLPKEGICYEKDKKIVQTPQALIKNLEKLPLIDHSILDLEKYKSISVETSRGCIRQCPFCFYSGYASFCYWRPISIKKKIEELKQIHNLTDISKKKIYFTDTNFAVNNKRIQNLSQKIIEKKLTSNMFTSVDSKINSTTLNSMRKMGIRQLIIGVESGAQTYIQQNNKFTNQTNMLQFIRNVKKNAIIPNPNFVLMNPNETKKDLYSTINFAKKISEIKIDKSIKTNTIYSPHIFRVYPNTKYFTKLVSMGWKPPQTFLDWGTFFQEGSTGDFHRQNFTRNIRKYDVEKVFFKFGLLNTKDFVIPKSFSLFKKRLF